MAHNGPNDAPFPLILLRIQLQYFGSISADSAHFWRAATAVHSMALPPKLGVDVGDVLSVKNVQNAEGAGLECIPRATKGVIYVVNYT